MQLRQALNSAGRRTASERGANDIFSITMAMMTIIVKGILRRFAVVSLICIDELDVHEIQLHAMITFPEMIKSTLHNDETDKLSSNNPLKKFQRLFQPSNLSIESKGLLVVGFALTVSVTLLIFVQIMLDQSESDLRRSEKLVQTQFAMNRYQETFFIAAQTMALYFMRRAESDVAVYRSERGQAKEAYERLKPLVDRPEQKEVLERLHVLQMRLFDMFDGVELTSAQGEDPAELVQLLGVRQQINGIIAQMIADMRTWKNRLDVLELASSSHLHSQRQLLQGFVWGAIAILIL